MSGINFLSENYVDEAAVSITTGTANAQFPLANIQNPSTAVKFRSSGNTVVIEFDLQQTRDIDTIAIAGDATGTFGITAASIKTSVTDDFTSSTAIPLSISAEQNMGYEFITSVSHRYVELTLTGTGSFAELGAVFIGERINLPLNSFSVNSFKYGYRDNSRRQSNRYSQKFIDSLPLVKQLGGTTEYATKAEQEVLDDMFVYHGLRRPLWVIVDPNSEGMNGGQYKLTMYSYMSKMPEWRATGGQLYNTNIDLEQVV